MQHYGPIISLKSFTIYFKYKGPFYRVMSNMKTHQPTLHFITWSLDLFIRVPLPLHGEYTVLPPIQRLELIVHIAIYVCIPDTHLCLRQVKRVREK